MKQTITFLLSLVAMLLPDGILAQTYTYSANGLTWHYTLNGTNATITGYAEIGVFTGDVVVPATVSDGINTYPVTGIGFLAFTGCEYERSFTFENTSTLTSMAGRVWSTYYRNDYETAGYGKGNIMLYIDMKGVTSNVSYVGTKISRGYAGSSFYRSPGNILIYLPDNTNRALLDATGQDWWAHVPANRNFVINDVCDYFYVYDEDFNKAGSEVGSRTHSCYIPHAFTATKAEFSRVFSNTSGKAVSTLYLPYPTDLPTGMQAYEFTLKGVDENGDKAFCFSPVPLGTRLQANHPYLVRVTDGATHTLPTMHNVQVPATPAISTTAQTSADGNWAFNGTTETLDNAAASALKAYYLNGNKWWAVQNGVANNYIAPYRCFVSSPTGAAPAKSFLMVIEEDNLTPTDIRQLERDTQADLKNGSHTFYSIDGKRIGTDYNALERGQMYIVNGKKFYKF